MPLISRQTCQNNASAGANLARPSCPAFVFHASTVESGRFPLHGRIRCTRGPRSVLGRPSHGRIFQLDLPGRCLFVRCTFTYLGQRTRTGPLCSGPTSPLVPATLSIVLFNPFYSFRLWILSGASTKRTTLEQEERLERRDPSPREPRSSIPSLERYRFRSKGSRSKPHPSPSRRNSFEGEGEGILPPLLPSRGVSLLALTGSS